MPWHSCYIYKKKKHKQRLSACWWYHKSNYLRESWIFPFSFFLIPFCAQTQHPTGLWALRSRCTWLWGSAHHRPCERPGPCLTSWSQRPWCRCSGKTGTWGSSCGGRSWAPGGDPCTTGTVRSAGTGSGQPSWMEKDKKENNFSYSVWLKVFKCLFV